MVCDEFSRRMKCDSKKHFLQSNKLHGNIKSIGITIFTLTREKEKGSWECSSDFSHKFYNMFSHFHLVTAVRHPQSDKWNDGF